MELKNLLTGVLSSLKGHAVSATLGFISILHHSREPPLETVQSGLSVTLSSVSGCVNTHRALDGTLKNYLQSQSLDCICQTGVFGVQ